MKKKKTATSNKKKGKKRKKNVTGVVQTQQVEKKTGAEEDGGLLEAIREHEKVHNHPSLNSEKIQQEQRSFIDFFLNVVRKDKGDVSVRYIVKNMPETVRALRDDLMDDGLFVQRVLSIAEGETRDAFSFDDAIARDVSMITQEAILDRYYSAAGRIPYECENARGRFATELEARLLLLASVFPANGNGEKDSVDWMRHIKMATDATCEVMAEELDEKVFRGKRGRFLSKALPYKKPLRYFISLLPQHVQRDLAPAEKRTKLIYAVDDSKVDLWIKFMEASEGIYDAHKTCGECGVVDSGVMRCGGCRAALYCGPECQKKAWKSGHKVTCRQTKQTFADLEENLALVNQMHELQLQNNIVPNFKHDFEAVLVKTLLLSNPNSNPWKGTPYEKLPVRAQYYFDNLRRVESGELWFFSGNESLRDYRIRVCNKNHVRRSEIYLVGHIHSLLCFDYEGYLRQEGSSTSDPAAFAVFEDSKFLLDFDEQGLKLPAARFLEICKERQTKEFHGTDEELAFTRKQQQNEYLKYCLSTIACFEKCG